MRRVVKTIDLSKTSSHCIPKNADKFYTKQENSEAIEIAIPRGKIVDVTIQTGIVLRCKVLTYRQVNNEPIYEVVQVGTDLKLKEQQKIGIPIDEISVLKSFIAFAHQIQIAHE